MVPFSSTHLPPLEYDIKKEQFSAKTRVSTNRIGWLHSVADKRGAKFDVVIKDAVGRVKARIQDFGGEAEKSGRLVNLETMVGEEISIEVENVRNAESLKLFVN